MSIVGAADAMRLSVARPRIAFLIRDLDIGGAQRQLVELASGFHRAGWPTTVFVFYPGGVLEPDLRGRGVEVVILDKHGRWDTVAFWYRLLRSVRRRHPAVLHSYLGTENIVAASLKPFLRGTRIVWGVRSSNPDYWQFGRLPGLISEAEHQLARFADLIICNSSVARDIQAARGVPARRLAVIPNGIDSERFRPDSAERSEVRREWGIGEGETLIGLVARLDPRKDHSAFLRAAAALAAERDDLRFVIVGDGPDPYRATTVQLAGDLGLDRALVWAGARMDMPRVYNALDLLVSSSSFEGFPNVVAEAMASGVPCVVTAAGDSTLLVGDTGWTCRPRDDDDLVRALRVALSDRAELRARGHRARQRIVDAFSPDRLVAATAEHFLELAHGRR